MTEYQRATDAMADAMAACTLYRYFAADGSLLYVGITSSRHSRAVQHSTAAEWWPLTVRATLTHYPNRADAEAAEQSAIISEHPLYNLRYNEGADRYRVALARAREWMTVNYPRSARVPDLAVFADVPVETVRRLLRQGALPCARVGTMARFTSAHIEDALWVLTEPKRKRRGSLPAA